MRRLKTERIEERREEYTHTRADEKKRRENERRE
jgi:hypothetical protein